MSKELCITFIKSEQKQLQNIDLTCREILALKNKFYKEVKKSPRISEWLLFEWLYHYLGIDSDLSNGQVSNGVGTLLQEKSYKAKHRKQNIDIVLKNKSEILIGISVKMSSRTSAYLDGADFENPLLKNDYFHKYIQDENEFEEKKTSSLKYKSSKDRIKVPTLLQDMARLENVNGAQERRFETLTILYSGKDERDNLWIEEFNKQFNHQYLFLSDHLDEELREVLENRLPSLKLYKKGGSSVS
jgi:hypothetical protein